MKERLRFSAGVLNCVSGAAMAVNTLFMLLFVIIFIALPVLCPVWFLPMALFIPAVGLVFFISLAATVCNLVSGVGSVLSSVRGGTVSGIFTVISTVVDGLFIPINLFFLVIWSIGNSVPSAVTWFSVLLLLVSAVSVALSISGLTVNVICLLRMKNNTVKQPKNTPNGLA